MTATLALFVALATGGAYAANELIGSGDIARNAVRSKHIKRANVKNSDLAANAVTSPKVADGSLLGEDFAAGQLPAGPEGPAGPSTGPAGGDLAGNYPNPTIADGAVTASKLGCGSDPNQVMVKVGSVCIDKYEASVWSAPTGGTHLASEAQIDAACPDNGQGCANFYARSVPAVVPARRITWFQAQQALANSGKQLPTNAEWQMAVSGTPDSNLTDCNINTGVVANTGANAGCVSRFGANDMIGNLQEWVADWVPRSPACGGTWPAGYGSDLQCLVGADTTGTPGVLIRGGLFNDAGFAGPFAVDGSLGPSDSGIDIGFRGAR